jgi:hypothetical protein
MKWGQGNTILWPSIFALSLASLKYLDIVFQERENQLYRKHDVSRGVSDRAHNSVSTLTYYFSKRHANSITP